MGLEDSNYTSWTLKEYLRILINIFRNLYLDYVSLTNNFEIF